MALGNTKIWRISKFLQCKSYFEPHFMFQDVMYDMLSQGTSILI